MTEEEREKDGRERKNILDKLGLDGKFPYRATADGIELVFSNPLQRGAYWKFQVQNRSGRDFAACFIQLVLFRKSEIVGLESRVIENLPDGILRASELVFVDSPGRVDGVRFEVDHCQE